MFDSCVSQRYCPCNGTCHQGDNPCSIDCATHHDEMVPGGRFPGDDPAKRTSAVHVYTTTEQTEQPLIIYNVTTVKVEDGHLFIEYLPFKEADSTVKRLFGKGNWASFSAYVYT